MKHVLRFVLLSIVTMSLWAGTDFAKWYDKDANNQVVIHVTLFLSTTCAHCHKADAYFKELRAHYPWIKVSRYFINLDKNGLTKFNQFLMAQGLNNYAVPSVFFCNSRWAGFASAETTGKALESGLAYCKNTIEKNGTLTQETIDVLRHKGTANLINSSLKDKPSGMKYIATIAIMNVLNLCSLFAFATLFALLFFSQTPKQRVSVGVLYLFFLGLVHITEQLYGDFFYHMISWLRYPAAFVGMFVFYIIGRYTREKSIDLGLFVLSFLLACVVFPYQETCLMNWSYVAHEWLGTEFTSTVTRGVYQFGYEFFYLLPSIVFFCVYVALIGRFWRLEWALKSIGAFYLLILALVLIVYPQALSNLAFSLMVLVVSVILGVLFKRFWPVK